MHSWTIPPGPDWAWDGPTRTIRPTESTPARRTDRIPPPRWDRRQEPAPVQLVHVVPQVTKPSLSPNDQ
jgi:hypothetical protein